MCKEEKKEKLYKSIPEGKLKKVESYLPRVKIRTSMDAVKFTRNFYDDDLTLYESVFAVFLNRSGETIGWTKHSQGGLSGTVIDPILIGKFAIEFLANSVILVHNHPSGSLRPSGEDMKVTRKLERTLRVAGSRLRDHIILTEEDYYSFIDNDLLDLD